LCDCYVSLTKTEGFGLGVFDAYQSKKDVIVTGYGGQIEYLQKDYDEIYPYFSYYPFDSWEDTFALIDTCDLIVTCDTSIAHAASCLGKTVIVLLHAAAYFTWNHNVDVGKTKWYKNAWCIRQTEPCKWEGSMIKCKELAIELLKENL
jgi:ADP-heptose:LPS heptosyltransferase